MDVSFELYVAKFYERKVRRARRDGYEFTLSLQSVHNLLKATKCYYTGKEMTRPAINANGDVCEGYKQKRTDLTIDRVDNSKGYVKGNVVACCQAANSFKSRVENKRFELSVDDMIAMASKLKARKS